MSATMGIDSLFSFRAAIAFAVTLIFCFLLPVSSLLYWFAVSTVAIWLPFPAATVIVFLFAWMLMAFLLFRVGPKYLQKRGIR